MTSLDDAKVSAVLTRLHREASHDAQRWAQRKEKQAQNPSPKGPDPLVRLGSIYMAFGEDEGKLLYLLTRSIAAKRIVEFGASFGVSSIYLAAAARDLGGLVITTEVHPDKCRVLRENVEEAGLVEQVEVLEGDARETLAKVDEPIDMLVLDGWKSMYLPILELVEPNLRVGGLVVADNISHPATQPYLDAMSASDSNYFTHQIGDLAISLRLRTS